MRTRRVCREGRVGKPRSGKIFVKDESGDVDFDSTYSDWGFEKLRIVTGNRGLRWSTNKSEIMATRRNDGRERRMTAGFESQT